MRAVLLQVDAFSGEFVDIDGSLQSLKDLVGGFIEHVQLVRSGRRGGIGMYVHDEGMIRDLPINRLATRLYWNTRRETPPGPIPYGIHGPAVILCGPDFDGSDLSVDQEAVNTIQALGVPVEGEL